jgi:hypothetical protein
MFYTTARVTTNFVIRNNIFLPQQRPLHAHVQ